MFSFLIELYQVFKAKERCNDELSLASFLKIIKQESKAHMIISYLLSALRHAKKKNLKDMVVGKIQKQVKRIPLRAVPAR